MTKIVVYFGRNIQNLKFETRLGKSVKYGLNLAKVTCGFEETYRSMPERDRHPIDVKKYVSEQVKYCKSYWDLHIATHSKVTVEALLELVSSNEISATDVTIHILNEQNSEICKSMLLDSPDLHTILDQFFNGDLV